VKLPQDADTTAAIEQQAGEPLKNKARKGRKRKKLRKK
jgi:hypothetical protein